MSKLPFPIFLLLLFSFYVFLYFSSYFFSFLFFSPPILSPYPFKGHPHGCSCPCLRAARRLPALRLPASCCSTAAASACELLRRCCSCLQAAWRRWLRPALRARRPAPRARREMPGAAHEEANGGRRRCELPPARRPSPTDRPPLPRLPPAVRARRASATQASPTRGQGWEKVPRSCSEPAGATFLWLRLARSAPVTRILGTWSRSRPWSTPFGRAPGEAGFGAGDGALPKGPLISVRLWDRL